MDEARAPTAGRRRLSRAGGLAGSSPESRVVLVILTVNVLASGPLVGADQRIARSTRSLASSPGWHGSAAGPAVV